MRSCRDRHGRDSIVRRGLRTADVGAAVRGRGDADRRVIGRGDARRVVAAGLPRADLGLAADHDELLGIRRPGPHRRAGRSPRRRRRHRRRLRDVVRRGISDPPDGADRALRRRRRGVDGRRQHVRVQLPSDHRRRRVLGPLVGKGGRHQSRREPVRQGRPRAAGDWPAVPRPQQLPSRGDRRRATWSSRHSRRSGSSGEATGRG